MKELRNVVDEIVREQEACLIEGINRYAEWDKSDPFTKARCMTHLRQGLLKPLTDGSDGHYNATKHATSSGAPFWTNMQRP